MFRKFTSLIFVFMLLVLGGCGGSVDSVEDYTNTNDVGSGSVSMNGNSNIDSSIADVDLSWYENEYEYKYENIRLVGDFIIGDEWAGQCENILIDYLGSDIDIVMPTIVNYISGSTFRGNTDIKSIIFGEDVYEIDDHAFEGCTNLEKVEFKGSTSMGLYAFKDCVNLSSVIFGEIGKEKTNNISLEPGVFYGCTSLESIKLPSNLVPDSANGSFEGIFENSGLKHADFEDSAIYVVDYLFWNAKNLETVNLPSNLQKICDYAFANSGLTKIIIYNADIDEGAFVGCENLEYVVIYGRGYSEYYEDNAFIDEGETAEDIDTIFYIEEGSDCEEYVKNLNLKYNVIEYGEVDAFIQKMSQ